MATISDIAKLTGVSPSTVSRVLNLDDTIKVTLETRTKIFEAAEQLSYNKNGYSKSKKPYAIIHWYDEQDELNDPFFLSIRLGIEKECKDKNVKLEKYYNSVNGHTFEGENKRFQGLILLGKFSDECMERYAKRAPRTILIHNTSKKFEYDCVVVDFRQLTNDVLDLITSHGHKRIGFIGGREPVVGSDEVLYDEREVMFTKYMTESGLYNENYVKIGQFSYKDGYELMKLMIKQKDDMPTCVFVASDTMAIGVLRALQEANIKIPEQLSLISCNSIPASKYTTPSLTTVRIFTDFMGRTGARLLLGTEERKEKIRIVMPHELVMGETFCKNAREE